MIRDKSFSNGNYAGHAGGSNGAPAPATENELWNGASDPRSLAMFGLP